jgi:hypothetical protein
MLVHRVVGAASGQSEQLVITPSSGGPSTQVPLRGGLVGAYWASDSTVAMAELTRGDTVKLSLLDLRTGAHRDELLPNDSTLTDFDWLSSHGWVWLSGAETIRFRRLNETTTHTIPMPDYYASLARLRAGPDGHTIAYLGWNRATWDTLRLATVSLDGGVETPLGAAGAENGALSWLADGSLSFSVLGGGEMLTLYHARRTGRVEKIGAIPWHAWTAEVSADLRRVALTLQDYRADAWLSQVVHR